jgi:Asp-tRNA(Asn)/Glu-tRNA(Gln) amidotransferase B subunit
MALHVQNYQQTLAKMQTLKSLNLSVGAPGNFNTNAVNAYAAAVAGLTAQKQAEMLATSGLNKAQIAEVLSRNKVNDAVINETLSKMNLKSTTQLLTTATMAEVMSTDMAADKTQEKAIADFLAANGSKKLKLELIQLAVAQGALTAEQAAGIIANNKLAFSWKALGASIKTAFMSNPVGWIMMIISAITMLVSRVKQAREEVV